MPNWKSPLFTLTTLTIVLAAALAATPPDALFPTAVQVASPDFAALRAEDTEREGQGLPPRYAVPHRVSLTPRNSGRWEDLGSETRLWQLRIESPGALSLNLAFSRYRMPPGGRMSIYAADASTELPPFSDRHNKLHGELWTPAVPSDAIVVEVVVPRPLEHALSLEIASINVGYRYLGEFFPDKAGACNVDVACPEALPWQNETRSVALLSIGGSALCTGFLVNNTAQDRKPYLMTAYHCGLTTANAASLVAYWRYQASSCDGPRDGSMSLTQSGSIFRAGYSPSDFTLVELEDEPVPAFQVAFAGWDRSNVAPSSAVCIHHPNADEKSISFENDPLRITTYLGTFSPGDGTHLRVASWDVGTTESGSSGAPLFNAQHRVVGQLHGGYDSCTTDLPDWFGRFATSWTGGGTPATRLQDWLDPLGTGTFTLDTLVPSDTNDDFTDAFALGGASGTASTTNVGATKEPSEPDHAGNSGGASLWWRFTAQLGGTATIDTFGSDFDTLLAVYTGISVASLTPVASNDNANGSLQSRVTFPLTQGTMYYVAVDGRDGATGNILLNWTLSYALPNDAFADAIALAGTSGTTSGTNLGATKEPGEPNHAGNSGGASVWWKITPTVNGTATIDTFGSSFDTLLAVYTGTAVNALTLVGANDDAAGGLQSSVTFNTAQGVTYFIAVDGFSGKTGIITLNWAITSGGNGSGWAALSRQYPMALRSIDPPLRAFRDRFILGLPGGHAATSAFYYILPTFSEAVARDPFLRALAGTTLGPSAALAALLGQ